jgi:RimJ/RimL family protein N-acetyltransferase
VGAIEISARELSDAPTGYLEVGGRMLPPRGTERSSARSEAGATDLRVLDAGETLASRSLGGLSEWFDPFLPGFLGETRRSGGEAWLSTSGEEVDGLLLYSPILRVGSVFTRSPATAERLLSLRRPAAIFSEHDLGPNRDAFDVYRTDLRDGVPPYRFRHPVRAAREDDLPVVLDLLREVHGGIDEGWFRTAIAASERCFVSELDGRIVGAGWASRAGAHGRLHSLCVRPRYRSLGIGTDLAFVRLHWLRSSGAIRIISEIAATNAASRRVAERAGMVPVGRLFEYHRF